MTAAWAIKQEASSKDEVKKKEGRNLIKGKKYWPRLKLCLQNGQLEKADDKTHDDPSQHEQTKSIFLLCFTSTCNAISGEADNQSGGKRLTLNPRPKVWKAGGREQLHNATD